MNGRLTFVYDGDLYPAYLREGNACQFIAPVAHKFCIGRGVDVGCGRWPLCGAVPLDLQTGGNAMDVPPGDWDYIFSSHCLEHLENPIAALEHWISRVKPGGLLFLYLPHPDQRYWRPENCRKHLHSWLPEQMASIMRRLGLEDVMTSGRDMAWSFAAVGWKSNQ